MNKSLFVAGLDYSITSDELKNIFAAHGTVESAKVITDRNTDRSKGFAFVDMSTQQEAEECIAQLNNSMQKNRQIIVKIKDDSRGNIRRSFGNNGGFSRR